MTSLAGWAPRPAVRRHRSTSGPRWILRGRTYWSLIAVKSLPYNLPGDFMQSIMQKYAYSAVSTSVYRISKGNAISRLDRAATRYGAEIAYRLEAGKQTESLADIHARVTSLRASVAADETCIIDVSIVFAVTGRSIREAEWRMKLLESELRTNGVGICPGRYMQRKLAGLFDANVHPAFPFVVSITEHFLPALMPLTQTPLCQSGGCHLGTDVADGSAVMLNRFAGANFNTVIMGKSGSGKSYIAKLLVLRETSVGEGGYFILDPLGEFMQIALFLGGVHRSVGTEGLGAGKLDVSQASATVAGVVELVCMAIQLNDRETATVKDLFYSHAAAGHGSTVAEAFSAVRARSAQSGSAEICRRLDRVLTGDLSFLLSGDMPEAGQERVIVFDYSCIDPRLKSAVAQFLLETVFEMCIHAGGRKTIIIDEAWRFGNDERLRASLSHAVRHSRHYNVAIMLLTQNVTDIAGDAFADGILNNTDSCFVFRHDGDASVLPEDYRLTPEERDFVNGFTPRDARRSRCVMIAAGRKVKLEIQSGDDEFRLCNSEALQGCGVVQFLCMLADDTLNEIDSMLEGAH